MTQSSKNELFSIGRHFLRLKVGLEDTEKNTSNKEQGGVEDERLI